MSHSTGGNLPRQTTLRSPLGRVRGRGAAKAGVQHWWMQRVTSVALLPLCIWFIVSLALSPGMSHAEALAWIGKPVNASLLLALIGMTFHHTASGLQVIIEDYVHTPLLGGIAHLANIFVCALAAIAGVLAIVRIALGS